MGPLVYSRVCRNGVLQKQLERRRHLQSKYSFSELSDKTTKTRFHNKTHRALKGYGCTLNMDDKTLAGKTTPPVTGKKKTEMGGPYRYGRRRESCKSECPCKDDIACLKNTDFY